MIQAFLFDLDGVIVDTAKFHYLAWKRMANELLGSDISEEFDESLKGVSRMESLDRILAHGGKTTLTQSEKEQLAQKKNDWYLELVKEMNQNDILTGIPTFIAKAKAAGIKIGLGSVSKNAPMILERIGLIQEFDVIIDGNKISKGKPDPEVFLNGAAALGFNPDQCLVFEDAVAGVRAGKNAGMKVIGIGKAENLPEADHVFENLANIEPLWLIEKIFFQLFS
jgi:beta-phosphoglucomutase